MGKPSNVFLWHPDMGNHALALHSDDFDAGAARLMELAAEMRLSDAPHIVSNMSVNARLAAAKTTEGRHLPLVVWNLSANGRQLKTEVFGGTPRARQLSMAVKGAVVLPRMRELVADAVAASWTVKVPAPGGAS